MRKEQIITTNNNQMEEKGMKSRFIHLKKRFVLLYCHASNYSSHLRQLYRKINPASPSYHLSQRAVFYGTFLSALLTIPILSHIVFS